MPCVNQCLANTKCSHPDQAAWWAAKPGIPGAPTELRKKLHSTFSLHLQRGLDDALQALISEAQDCGKEKKKQWNYILRCFLLFYLVIF